MPAHKRPPTSLTARRMAKQADAAIAAETESTPAAASPEMLTLRLVLAFAVDGTVVGGIPLVAEIERPQPDQLAQLQLTLDGRMLASLLEPHLGPQPSKLWTPAKG